MLTAFTTRIPPRTGSSAFGIPIKPSRRYERRGRGDKGKTPQGLLVICIMPRRLMRVNRGSADYIRYTEIHQNNIRVPLHCTRYTIVSLIIINDFSEKNLPLNNFFSFI